MIIFTRIKNNIKYKVLKLFKPEIIGFSKNFQGKKVKDLRISNTSHISNRENVILNDGVFIAHFTYIDGFKAIEIGAGCGIASYTSILTHSGHNTIRLYGDKYSESYSRGINFKGQTSAPVIIGSYTFLGPHSIVMPGSKIGKGCIVAAYTLVNGTFEDYSIIRGNPAKVVGNTRTIDEAFLKKYPDLRQSYYLNAIESTQFKKYDSNDAVRTTVQKITHRCRSFF